DSSGNGEGLLMTGGGTSWTPTEAPLPANAAAGSVSLQSVACPSTTSCVAIGRYRISSGPREGLLVTGAGTSWTPTEAPLPADAAQDPEVFLQSVACSSDTNCAAFGIYTSVNDHVIPGLALT